jgi:hypothetical protein
MPDSIERRSYRPHWYFIYEESCPVCGHTRIYRERRYGSRPERWEDRHDIDYMAYDWCDAL